MVLDVREEVHLTGAGVGGDDDGWGLVGCFGLTEELNTQKDLPTVSGIKDCESVQVLLFQLLEELKGLKALEDEDGDVFLGKRESGQ
jgi:hypothetical protein